MSDGVVVDTIDDMHPVARAELRYVLELLRAQVRARRLAQERQRADAEFASAIPNHPW